MRDVLLGPFAAGAIVLVVAGVAKLRTPGAAARAALTLGLPASGTLVRALAVAELALALWCVAAPAGAGALCLATAYMSFAAIAFLLARRQSSCGCFGGGEAPAGAAHWLLSAALASVAAAAARWTPHGLLWAFAHHPVAAPTLALGVAGIAYAVVIVYTQLPPAWSAWRVR